MISYGPFWKTLKIPEKITYTLVENHHISNATLDKLRRNRPVTTTTLNGPCRILNTDLSRVAEYVSVRKDEYPE